MTKYLLFNLIWMFSSINCIGQVSELPWSNVLLGQWEGAFIKGNVHQQMDVRFFIRDSSMISLQIIEDWHPAFGEFELPVSIDSTGMITMNTGYGKAILYLDSLNLEMTGVIENKLPSIYLHFKKALPDPEHQHTLEEIRVSNGDVELYGHLHLPVNHSSTVMIIVGGRGCYAGSTQYDLYAKMMRQYGVAVLAYHKRGTGRSSGDCNLATIENLASDVGALAAYLRDHPAGFTNIGVLGSSAGGWVIAKASEKTEFDFMISVVGPSTSVYEQQIQSMEYGIDEFGLSEEAANEIRAYTDLVFNAPANEESYEAFKGLLAVSTEQGWRQLLDDTDIPSSAEGIDSLWVRRHNYDPGNALRSFEQPFLAIYGQKDWIVPYRENVDRLDNLFSGPRSSLLTTVVAPYANHGTDVDEQYIQLSEDISYWRFFRISPHLGLSLIKFFKKHGFID